MKITQEKVTDELKRQINDCFTSHSNTILGGFNEMGDPVSFVVRDDNGNFCGAVTAMLFWGALHIKTLIVEDKYRGQRLGSKLMDTVLEYAKEHNCSFAFVETLSFQALDFYLKHGFVLEFTRPGYSQGISFHYLKKNLAKK